MTDKTMKYVYHFTRKEIEATGAKFADVKEETILKLDALRTKINRPFVLVKNGLTTGQHKSKQHGQGEAVDGFFKDFHDYTTVFKCALEIEFRGIGIYYNYETRLYSYHFDLGPEFRFWTANKRTSGDLWIYHELIRDPKTC